jgi:hypothetical protein
LVLLEPSSLIAGLRCRTDRKVYHCRSNHQAATGNDFRLTFWATVLAAFLAVEGSGASSLNQFATRLAAEQREMRIV